MNKLLHFYLNYGTLRFSQNPVLDVILHTIYGAAVGFLISVIRQYFFDSGNFRIDIALAGLAFGLLCLFNQRLAKKFKSDSLRGN